MCIRHLLLKDEPDKVVRLRYDDSSIAKKPDGVEPVSADGKISGYNAVPTIGMMVAKQVRNPSISMLGAPKSR